MLVVVSYDVDTTDIGGRRRLRRIARACQDYGQRVQFSVFECEVTPGDWVKIRARLLAEMDEIVVIPHSERVESLNAGVAASIVLYEIARRK